MRGLKLFLFLPLIVVMTIANSGCNGCNNQNNSSTIQYSAVSAGTSHTCGLATSGAVYCWGDNSAGQLGTGNNNASNKPVLVSGGMSFTKVAAGGSHTCAVSQGSVFCWGLNLNGQIGNGGMPNGSPALVPTKANTPAGVQFKDVAVGNAFSCALADTGKVFCWGQGGAGKLGQGANFNTGNFGNPVAPGETNSTPLAVAPTQTFKSIFARNNNACAVTTAGSNLFCWGDNLFHQLGAPPANTETCGFATNFWPCSKSPVAIPIGTTTGATVSGVALGPDYSCMTDGNYNATCLGGNATQQIAPTGVLPHCAFPNGMNFECANTPQSVTRPQANFGFVEFAAGDSFACSSFYPVGTPIHCWGKNDHGQLGDGTNTDRGSKAPLSVSLGALSLSAGSSHACVVADGANANQIYCWGSNSAGQIGNGTTGTDAKTPVRIVEP